MSNGYQPQPQQKQTMNIVPQTKIAFAGYLLLFVAQIVYMLRNPDKAAAFLPNLIGFIIIAILGLYVINCSVVGHCNTYAWVMGYLVAAVAVVTIVMIIYKLI